MHRFKVSSLRNIALTMPYMQDASAKDLKEAVRIMLQYQSDAKPQQQEIGDITPFLESLNGGFEGKKLQ